jgi:hypothetical protein
MSGAICLQGGHEFTAGCRKMDTEVLALAGPGPVAGLAGAARPGSDYAGASSRATRHYAVLGADVVTVSDPREGVGAALDVLTDEVALLILPGGSPASLRDVLSGEVEERVREMHAHGLTISGASAGAMVLCSRMVRPGGSADATEVVNGLGLVEGLALPHWSPGSDRGWPVPDDLELWGLPECGGILIDGDGAGRTVRAVGQGEPAVRRDGAWQPVDRGTHR